jgi:hypothetical protein
VEFQVRASNEMLVILVKMKNVVEAVGFVGKKRVV